MQTEALQSEVLLSSRRGAEHHRRQDRRAAHHAQELGELFIRESEVLLSFLPHMGRRTGPRESEVLLSSLHHIVKGTGARETEALLSWTMTLAALPAAGAWKSM